MCKPVFSEQEILYINVQTSEEIQRVAALGEIIWRECYGDLLDAGQIEYMLERFQSAAAVAGQLQAQGYIYWLVQVQGQDAGYIGVQPEGGRLLLSKLYLLPQYRGTILAAKALQKVEQAAKEHHCAVVWLTVNRHNARAVAAYQKCGFTTVRQQVADIGNGYVMDDFIMEKQLP